MDLAWNTKEPAPIVFTTMFVIASSATFNQDNDFGLVPGASSTPPSVRNDGTWTSTANTNIVVNTMGAGSFVFQAKSMLSVTGVNFATNSIEVDTMATFLGVTGNIGALSGKGNVSLAGKQFSFGVVTINSLNHVTGATTIASGNGVNYLSVQNGNFIVNGELSCTNFNFTAGTVSGQGVGTSSIRATNALFSGSVPKFVTNLAVTADFISWNCGDSCQLVNNAGQLSNPSSKKVLTATKKVVVAEEQEEEVEEQSEGDYDQEILESWHEDHEVEDFEGESYEVEEY